MIEKKAFSNVSEYFEAQPVRVKNMLLQLRECILKAVPESEELLNYNIPSFTLIKGGKREEQIMIAGYKNHIGFYPHPTTIEQFKEELKPFKNAKGSIQFSLEEELPIDLITRMIIFRKNIILKIFDKESSNNDKDDKIAKILFSSVYPHYITKIEKHGRTKYELLAVIEWLTGYNETDINELIKRKVTFKEFFESAIINSKANLIKGVICGHRVEEIKNPLTQKIRYLDKLVDELAKGKKIEKIFRIN